MHMLQQHATYVATACNSMHSSDTHLWPSIYPLTDVELDPGEHVGQGVVAGSSGVGISAGGDLKANLQAIKEVSKQIKQRCQQ